MKKTLSKILIILIVSCIYIQFTTAAMWIPGSGANGDDTGPGKWVQSSTNTVRVSYDQLEELCMTANIAIQGNHYQSFMYDLGAGFHARIYIDSDNIATIRLYTQTNGATVWYLCAVGNSGSTLGRYYAYPPTDDSHYLKPMLDKIEAIRLAINNTLTPAINNITAAVNNVDSRVSSLQTTANNIYSRLVDILSVVRKNYYFGYKSDANNVDYPTIPISWDTANSICSYINNNFNHDGTINYISVSNQVGAQYTFYHARVASSGYIVVNVYEGGSAHDFVVCDRNHNCYMASDTTSYDHISTSLSSIIGYIDGIESTLSTISSRINTTNTQLNTVNSILSQIAGNTDEDIYVTLYTSDSNGNSYSTVSYRPEIIDGLVSYINTHLANKPLNVLYRDGQDGQIANIVRNMMYVDITSTGYVRLRVMWNNNSVGYAYLSSPNHVLIKQDNTYVADTTFYQKLTSIETAINNISTDNSSVVAAIDRIYDWLDNADLATNATIIQVVQDYSNDVNNSVEWGSKILDLFKHVYIFDRPAPSYSGILDYFSSLGSD